MNILITGGAGYIGSHVAKQLLENSKHNIIKYNDLALICQSAYEWEKMV